MTRRKEERDPVTRKVEWLAAHPGGTVGSEPGTLLLEARTAGQVIATAYDDLRELMDRTDAAEGAGKCPLHGKTEP